jgi:hypothetical protein
VIAIISPRLTGIFFGSAIASLAVGSAPQHGKDGCVMGTAHDGILAGSDLHDSFCLVMLPDRLVVLELGGIFKNLCSSHDL